MFNLKRRVGEEVRVGDKFGIRYLGRTHQHTTRTKWLVEVELDPGDVLALPNNVEFMALDPDGMVGRIGVSAPRHIAIEMPEKPRQKQTSLRLRRFLGDEQKDAA